MTILKIAALSSLIVAAALTGCSSSNYGPAIADQMSSTVYKPHNQDFTPNYRASTSIGSVMTTREGATVYTFDKDQLSKPTCYADCAQKWPPVIAPDGAQPYGRMSLASRDDGRRQWAYDGKPLYTFSKDRMHGDVKGENAENDWHVVR
jgi:predicted lipoprotein with Yx(FWY)xxD motif